MARARVFVSLDYQGALKIEGGYILTEDEARTAAVEAEASTGALTCGEIRNWREYRRRTRGIIPTRADQNPCAQSRIPMDMMRQGCSTSLFPASQQWSTISSYELKTRFDSQLSRRNCPGVLCRVEFRAFAGNGTIVIFGGMASLSGGKHG